MSWRPMPCKHGALSVPNGAVTVDWEIGPSELGPSRFRLNWREHHGPQVKLAATSGFRPCGFAAHDWPGAARQGEP